MMNQYKYSPSLNLRYLISLLPEYINKAALPTDMIDISDDMAAEFFDNPAPDGKVRAAGPDGLPAWVDIAALPNDVLLSSELSLLAIAYKKDIADLNTAYLAAIVNDGPSEVTKQQIVREQINQRKSQYISDISSAKEKYPV